MVGLKQTWGLLVCCLVACSAKGGDHVGKHTQRPDRGKAADGGAASEVEAATTTPSLSADATVVPDSGVSAASPSSVEVTSVVASTSSDADGSRRSDDNDAGRDEPFTGSSDAGSSETSPSPSPERDATPSELDAATPEFELSEEEDCTGVEFVDPEQACRDLGGLSLGNPVLVTDEDREWNPGDVATLEVDVVGEVREGDEAYVAPAVVAVFDVESSSFASVQWRTFQWFGVLPGKSAPHTIELTLAESAPRGATVWLYLEPASTDGRTTACDCPEVDVTGLTLRFEVQ